MTGARPTRLLTVSSPGATGDFVVTADSTFGELAPLLVAALVVATLDEPSVADPAREGCWFLALGDRVLDPEASPESERLLHGDVLCLTRQPAQLGQSAQPAPSRPPYDPRRRRFGSASGG